MVAVRGLDEVAHIVALSLHVRLAPATDLNRSDGAGRAVFEQGKAMSDIDEFTKLDDSALLSRRAEMRAELERLPAGSVDRAVLAALYDKSTEEVNDRATKAWAQTGTGR
jgi:hypothetical protein